MSPATCPSGEGTACKAVDAGSIPAVALTNMLFNVVGLWMVPFQVCAAAYALAVAKTR